MNRQNRKWEILEKSRTSRKSKKGSIETDNIINILLKNRGIKTEKDQNNFIKPKFPEEIKLEEVGIKKQLINKVITRLKKALQNNEEVIIYGDYDADGICATAILWECLYSFGLKVLPHIPERFSEGYGINIKSVENLKLKNKNLKLIITVDNGISANDEIDEINKLGIDVIITDHHQPHYVKPARPAGGTSRDKEGISYPKAYNIIHTDKISGAEIAWFVARELRKNFKVEKDSGFGDGLELAAIGTIADQIELLRCNRSIVKYGLAVLNKTKRPGLSALFRESEIKPGEIGPYEVGFIIAPKINSMGRLKHAIDSLRLLCVKGVQKANELAIELAQTNKERQRIVDEVVIHAKNKLNKDNSRKVIILAHESYHEGVIGLAASKLVDQFYKPAIVISKGKEFSKASARSVPGFNIIENLRKLEDIFNGGGHPMAAGFTLKTSEIELFIKKFEKISNPLLTEEILSKKLKIDMELDFAGITNDLLKNLKLFEPTGLGNPTPTFLTRKTNVVSARTVGRDNNHLKLKVGKSDITFDAIAFNLGDIYSKLSPDKEIDVVYSLEENIWNERKSIQLKIKDLRIN